MSVHVEKDDDDAECPHCERIGNAVDAIVSVVNMFKPDQSDGFNALAISIGLTLAQFVKEDDVEEVVESICEQALYVFRKENNIPEEASGEGSIVDDSPENPPEQIGEKPKTRH